MNLKKQQIAIAQACGWTYSNKHPIYGRQSFKLWHYKDTEIIAYHWTKLPNYLHDLNAMHEAERILDGYMMLKYASELLAVIGGGSGCFSHIHATAAQRSEAFLRTLGKWEESK